MVLKRTYFNHKKYHNPLSQFSKEFGTYLNQHNVVSAQGPSQDLTRELVNTESGPQDDCTTQVTGVVDCGTVEVSVVSH